MKHHSFSVWSFWLMFLTILFRRSLSIENRTIKNRGISFKSGFIAASGSTEGNEDRNKARGLTTTISSTKIPNTDDEDDSTITSTETIDEIFSASNDSNKGSIARQTSSVATTKEYSSSVPESMGIHFVKPETGSPSMTPQIPTRNWTTKSSTPTPSSISSSSPSTSVTKMSANIPVSSPTTTIATLTRTNYPTVENPQSIASRTSTIDDQTRVPLSASMEFDKAETMPPSTLKLISNTKKDNSTKSITKITSASSVHDNKTAGDNHLISSDTNIPNDDSLPTTSTMNSTSSSLPLLVPKEKIQPKPWPEIVSVIFVVVAIVFFGVTAFSNHRKRKDYQEIPISMTV